MTSKWNLVTLNAEEQESENRLIERFGSTPAIARLLARRGIRTVQQAEDFFHPSLKRLHDPFLMPDMDKAVNRLNQAIGSKERVMVYGDYDVDGTTAVALVYRYLLNFSSNLTYYVPGRYDEGYGITCTSIDTAAEQGVGLIIALDCGIKAVDEVEYARSKGIDVIICDHHVQGDELPRAVAILNPKLEGSPYPCPHLSGCGVGYKLMQAFAKSNALPTAELDSMLDLVAVSIAADIVPMVDENRILAYYGLRRLNSNPNLGLKAIVKVCGLSSREITLSDVIFKIGPRINASGRMQNGIEAVDLLVSRDMDEALERARAIDHYNKERKELDKRITDEATALIEAGAEDYRNRKAIVLYNNDWHRGIIGIVASRITELYYKPAVVLTLNNGLATGSSRSVQGFDVYKAVESVSDLLENFGGHTYAVGLSMREENIPEFTRRFEEYVEAHILPYQTEPLLDIDAEISFGELEPEFFGLLRRFNPYGPGNSVPVFCTRGVMDFGTSKLVGKSQEHIKLELVDDTSGKVYNGIAFNMADRFDLVRSGEPFDIAYTIVNSRHHPGGSNVQLQVRDIRKA